MLSRVLDLVVASVALVALAPLMAITAILVWWDLGHPVLFRQRRPGLRGRAFVLYKFRTMTESIGGGEADPVASDAERLSPLGRWLRAMSLDELPELWNVVRGEMALVGPRPLLMDYLPLYDSVQGRRHEVRPGLTGWAQINGRNDMSWEEKLALDVWYVDNRSWWLDLKILARTVPAVLRRDGVAKSGHATTERFRGRAP